MISPRSCVILAKEADKAVASKVMQEIYETVKTSFKYGVVLKGQNGKPVDSPSIFCHLGR